MLAVAVCGVFERSAVRKEQEGRPKLVGHQWFRRLMASILVGLVGLLAVCFFGAGSASSATADAPTNVVATIPNSTGSATGSATVSWNAPASNGGSIITGYSVTSSPVVTPPPGCKNTYILNCTFTGLTNGKTYTFTVTANYDSKKHPSARSNPVIPSDHPYAPFRVTATPGDTTATLSWPEPLPGGSIPTGYLVTSSPVVTPPAGCTKTSNLTCTFTGLTNGKLYTFTVMATYSAFVSGHQLNATSSSVTPSAPMLTMVKVTSDGPNSSAVMVDWSPAGTSNTYKVTAKPGLHSCSANKGDSSCTVTGLPNGKTYTFTVGPSNGSDKSKSAPLRVSLVGTEPSSTSVAWVAALLIGLLLGGVGGFLGGGRLGKKKVLAQRGGLFIANGTTLASFGPDGLPLSDEVAGDSFGPGDGPTDTSPPAPATRDSGGLPPVMEVTPVEVSALDGSFAGGQGVVTSSVDPVGFAEFGDGITRRVRRAEPGEPLGPGSRVVAVP